MRDENTFLLKKEKYALQNQWRRSHMLMMFTLSGIMVVVEVLMAFFIPAVNLRYSTMQQYLFKYVVSPALCYFLVDVLVYLLVQLDIFPFVAKNYFVSFGLASICLLMCFMHDFFISVFASGILAILLTAIYSDILITVATTIYLLIGEFLIGFFNKWDSSTIRNSEYLINIVIFLIILVVSCGFSIVIIKWEEKRIIWISKEKVHMDLLQKQASIDPLTGLQNRRALRKYIDTQENQITFVMTDINKFKLINDNFGHATGDEILSKLGNICEKYVSDNMSSFRYGGDEFLFAFINTSIDNVKATCQSIQKEFVSLLSDDVRNISDGLSIGITTTKSDESPRDALHRADEALYSAKKLTTEKIKII